MATEPIPPFDPSALADAMQALKGSIIELQREFAQAKPERAEARAAVRQKARTGELKPVRQPRATGPVGPRQTGPVGPLEPFVPEPQAVPGEAVEGWESLSELAAQNEPARPRPQKPRPK